MRVELLEGLRYLWADTRIRALAFSTILFNFFSNITFSIFLVYAVRGLDLGAGGDRLLLAIGNIGGLAAALLARRDLAATRHRSSPSRSAPRRRPR